MTKGELLSFEDADAIPAAGAVINLRWVNNSGQGSAKATDQLLAVIYNPANGVFEVRQDFASRDEGALTITLPDNFVGDLVLCYLSFISALAANSIYMGELAIV